MRNSSSSFNTIDEKGNNYSIYHFPVDETLLEKITNHPLYFTIIIRLKANEEIDELNIKIFKEDNTRIADSSAVPTELLLRVEWSNVKLDKDVKRVHAQPHWHIHSYKTIDLFSALPFESKKTILELIEAEPTSTNSILSNTEPEQLEDEKANTPPIKEIPSFRFHLSMLSEWDKSKKSVPNKTLTIEVLELWLPQCLSYIKDQIEYILERF